MEQSREMVKLAYEALEEKKGENIQVIEIKDISIIADYFIIANGMNAPQVDALVDNVKYYTGLDDIPLLSKFMLLDFKVIPRLQHDIEGVVHSSGSARFQTVFQRNDNPFLHDLLHILNSRHGVKALINTSFNRKNEPMVHTFADSWSAAEEMNLDALVYNGKLIPF